jgi:hypothetical protein
MSVIDIRTGRPVTNLPERQTAQAASPVAVATRLAVGCTLENGTLRSHRFRDHIVLWDLTHAGKRGKKVTKLNLSPSYTMPATYRDAIMEQIALLLESLQSYGVAAAVIGELASVSKQLELSYIEERGIDVPPPAFKTISIQTGLLDLTASYTDFSIRCRMDQNNIPSAIPRGRNTRKAVQRFYAWVSANQDRIKTMSFREVLSAMIEQDIPFHQYCAMD